jgi:hypothetical protein
MTDTQIENIENKLLQLAIEGNKEATWQYADLYLCRLDWERTRSAENRRDFVDQAQDAQAWLTDTNALMPDYVPDSFAFGVGDPLR